MKPGTMSLTEAVAKIKAEAAANGETLTNTQAKKRLWADHPTPTRGEPLVDMPAKEIRAAIDRFADSSGIEMSEFTRAKMVGIARGYADLTRSNLTSEEAQSIRAILAGLPSLGKKR